MALSMSEEEICASFRNSVNPKKQVKILAQLNACGEEKIKAVLEARNITVPQGKTRAFKYERMQWTPERKETVRRMIEAGRTREEIADYFLCSKYAVDGVMGRMGLKSGKATRNTPWRKFRDNRQKPDSFHPAAGAARTNYIGKDNAG